MHMLSLRTVAVRLLAPALGVALALPAWAQSAQAQSAEAEGTSAQGIRCGRRAGAAQPWSSHAPRKGVNTWNGVPPCVVSRPGATAYGEPVRTSGTSSTRSTASSRRRP